jgi:long-chain acyl-CoA synthetase
MDKIWLKSYPQGVPHEIDPGRTHRSRTYSRQGASRFGAAPAFTGVGATLTYADIDRKSRELAASAAALRADEGRRRVVMPNVLRSRSRCSPRSARDSWSSTATRSTPGASSNASSTTPARRRSSSSRTSRTRYEEVVEGTPVRAVITTEIGDLFPTIKGLLVNLVVKYGKKMVPPWHIAGATAFNDALAVGRKLPFENVPLTPDDIAFLQYTGEQPLPASRRARCSRTATWSPT